MKKVLVAGGVSLDSLVGLETLPEPRAQTVFARSFRQAVGSTGAGKALALSKLGLDVTFHAFIGEDAAGEEIRRVFSGTNVRTVFEIDPKGTERHINLMDGSGNRISIFVHTSTFEPSLDLSRLEPLVAGSDLVVLNIINYCRRLIPLVKKHGRPLWTDIHDWDGENPYHRDFVNAADAVFMSSDSLPDYQLSLLDLVGQGKDVAVATHGARGSTLLDRTGHFTFTPAVTLGELRDINGAGDNFFAGFLWAYLEGRPMAECAEIASVAGGLCVTSQELVSEELSPETLERARRAHFRVP